LVRLYTKQIKSGMNFLICTIVFIRTDYTLLNPRELGGLHLVKSAPARGLQKKMSLETCVKYRQIFILIII